MKTYAIGDVQGCYYSLLDLLEHIGYRPNIDTLWFVGDLVNRGQHSLSTLRFIQQLPNTVVVLGNHDLHLLAQAQSKQQSHGDDTLNAIFTAPDRENLLFWLRQQPLFHYDNKRRIALSHAGLLPNWTLSQVQTYAHEVETALRDEQEYPALLGQLYGNQPDNWRHDLQGIDRLRFIINALTRMRFCDHQGKLVLDYKGDILNAPPGLSPWFERIDTDIDYHIIFGHWAALNGQTSHANIHAIDTGCVWGNRLTAIDVDTFERFSVAASPKDLKQHQKFV